MSLRACLLALLALPAAARAEDLVLTNAVRGFRVARPDASWISYETQPAGPSAPFTLTLFPRGSQGLPSAVIYVLDSYDNATSEQIREAAAAKLRREGADDLVLDEAPLAGRPAARLRARAKASTGLRYEVELRYLVAPPLMYALQLTWAEGKEPDAPLIALRDSFALVAPERPAADPARDRLSALADRCGSDLPWAQGWEEAAARARAEDRLVLVVYEHFTVIEVPHVIASGALTDEDFAALVRERFVALRLDVDDPAPFRAADAWGMGSHSWGDLLMFVSPDGKVLEQTSVSNAFTLADTARRLLAARAPRKAPPAPREREARLAQVALCLRRGELEQAETLLGPLADPQAHRLRATLRRQQRRGADALAELAAAREGADDALLADIEVEEGVVKLRLAQWTEAGAALTAALESHPDSPRAGEAQFWLGAVEMLTQGFPAGRERWRAWAEAHPDDRWAWKCAANVLDGGAFVNGGERPDWPDAQTLAAVAAPPREPLAATELARAQRDAEVFLLAAQRDDGSWISPMDAFGVQTSSYTHAITALCGSSLLPGRGRDEVADAIRRARDYLLTAHGAEAFVAGEDMMGVYSIWSRAFVLRFLAQCRHAGLGGEADLAPALTDLLDSVLESQRPGGGWPYVVVAGESGDSGFDSSASFLTAGVLIALLDARAAGLEVPQGPVDRGLAFLSGLRQPDGTFRYFADVPEADGDPEAAGRGPVCALALLRGGAGDRAGLLRALKVFDGQRAVLAREWGKDLCHTGEQGQGAHYLFYDWAFAALAVAELPAADRVRWRKPLLTDILAVRDSEGAYADMPSLGRAYGTAMALTALRALDG